MERNSKRIVIILAYVIIFTIIGFLGYLIFGSSATCMDQKKNQGETGVDCGGPCSACVVALVAQDIKIEEKFFVAAGPSSYDVGARIMNPNDALGSPRFNYRFILKDANGTVLAEKSGTDFILFREKKYILAFALKTDATPASVEVEISNGQWREFTNYWNPNFSISKHYREISSGTGFGEAVGLVRNENPIDYPVVKIHVVLRDAAGQVLAFNQSELRSIRAKEERDFRLVWPLSFLGSVEGVEVEANVNVFELDNNL